MRKLRKYLKSFLNFWEFIQNKIGEKEVKQHNLPLSHRFKESCIYYINHDDSHCCGKHIFINRDTDEKIIFRHEYGHRIQSLILGPLFYPFIFIPSYLHFLYWSKFKNDNWDDYYNFYCENWANSLSKKKNKQL